MAGEYYRWLARNEKPEEKRELTRAEKRRNWWDYHKWHVVIAIVCVLLTGDFVWDMVEGHLNTPDYCIAYVGEVLLPDDTVEALETAFAELGEDLTGNGKVQVVVQQYQITDTVSTDPAMLEQSAESSYAASVQLMANIQTAESVLFLLEDPEDFQSRYEILARVDGTFPEDTPDSDVPVGYAWSDCPVLTGLDLGNFVLDDLMIDFEGSNQELLSGMYIARRGFWNSESSTQIDGALKLWDILTEGAAK